MKTWACLGAIAAIVASSAAVAQASFPGQNGRIVFAEDHALYTMQSDGTDVQSLLGPPPPRRNVPAWSPNGAQVAYALGTPGGPVLAVANADGTGETVVHPGPGSSLPAWSPDGTQIAFTAIPSTQTNYTEIFVVDATGGTPTQLTFESQSTQPSWSPDGTRIAFTRPNRSSTGMGDFPQRDIWVMDSNGGNPVKLTDTDQIADFEPDWSPDGSRIVFSRWEPDQLVLVDPDTGQESVLLDSSGVHPDWSPDGTKVLYLDIAGNLMRVSSVGTNPTLVRAPDSVFLTYPAADWQPLPYPGYARPKGASPMRVSLVPAYTQCTSPNAQHGSPLDSGSCNPPVQQSGNVSVGKSMSGFVRYRSVAGNPATAADEADIALEVQITDVREQGTLADYTGEVRPQTIARLTDRTGTAGGPATVSDLGFSLNTQCTPTAETNVGSTCSLTTTLDTLIPGAVAEGRRTLLELTQVQVIDGGADGDTATEPNEVFLRQGLFVP